MQSPSGTRNNSCRRGHNHLGAAELLLQSRPSRARTSTEIAQAMNEVGAWVEGRLAGVITVLANASERIPRHVPPRSAEPPAEIVALLDLWISEAATAQFRIAADPIIVGHEARLGRPLHKAGRRGSRLTSAARSPEDRMPRRRVGRAGLAGHAVPNDLAARVDRVGGGGGAGANTSQSRDDSVVPDSSVPVR